MDDLDITRLCAKAMGLDYNFNDESVWIGTDPDSIQRDYDPLHDDAQAMALVKKFNMVIERERTRNLFGVTLFAGKNGTHVVRAAPDLNRAICECVAKSQRKEG